MSLYHKSSSKKTHVICRVESCGKSIVKQNYKLHLETIHSNEDSNDLREKGQPKLFFSKKIKVSELDKGFKHSDNEGKDNLSYSFDANVQQFKDQYSDPGFKD